MNESISLTRGQLVDYLKPKLLSDNESAPFPFEVLWEGQRKELINVDFLKTSWWLHTLGYRFLRGIGPPLSYSLSPA